MKNLFLLVMSVTFSVNYAQKTIKDNGIMVTKEHIVDAYNQVVNTSSLDVVLTQDEMGKIRIEASENIEPYIITEVQNQELTIKLKPNHSYHFKHKVKIYVPINEDLRKITMNGSGDIYLNNPLKINRLECNLTGSGDVHLNLIAKELYLDLKGSGDLKAIGETNFLKAQLKGSGDIEAKQLIAKNVEAALNGSGDVSVYAQEQIRVSVDGSGDITIYGNPQNKETKIRGSGDITFK